MGRINRGASRLRRYCSPQRWVAALALFHYVVLSLGIPMPVEIAQPTDGKPYPCVHHRCGCKDADSCWKSCCCMTLTERLAWAKNNGVQPPAFVLAQLESQLAKAAPVAEEHAPRRGCCKSAHAESHVTAHARQTEKTQISESPAAKPSVKETNCETVSISFIEALRCQGNASGWGNVPWSIEADERIVHHSLDSRVERCCVASIRLTPSETFPPPVPPPRCG